MTYVLKNCPKCGGDHWGSYTCPFSDADIARMKFGCMICANGNDLPEGEYCRFCGLGRERVETALIENGERFLDAMASAVHGGKT